MTPKNGIDFAADMSVKPAVRSSLTNFKVSLILEFTDLCELKPVWIVFYALFCTFYLTVSLDTGLQRVSSHHYLFNHCLANSGESSVHKHPIACIMTSLFFYPRKF